MKWKIGLWLMRIGARLSSQPYLDYQKTYCNSGGYWQTDYIREPI